MVEPEEQSYYSWDRDRSGIPSPGTVKRSNALIGPVDLTIGWHLFAGSDHHNEEDKIFQELAYG